jgi:hypothetical protein
MEPLNSLEKLSLLEKKIAALVELIKTKEEHNTKLVEHNSKLLEEKLQLATRLEQVENSLLKGTQNIEELNMVVDEFISSIDRNIDRVVEHAQ